MLGRQDRIGWFRGCQEPCEQSPRQRMHPYRLVLLGPPGVGKGTQAALLGRLLRACHLSTGDLFRDSGCERSTTPAMQAALRAMKLGELVADEVVVEMVRERAGCLRCPGGFLLDGFPRTVYQAQSLAELLEQQQVALDAVINYELPIDKIVARLSGRRTCPNCKVVYHTTAQPPRNVGRCDSCGAPLVQREDDRPEAIRVRMSVYEDATRPLTEYYSRSNLLLRVSAGGAPKEIRDRTVRLLHARLRRQIPIRSA